LAIASSSAIASNVVHVADSTRRHIAVRLLPFLFILYITNYLDRASLAYAALGMLRDLQFSDRVFGLGTGIFFISYVALQIPGALLVERWSARRMITATLIAWGSLTGLTALVHTPGQLYLARFALGAAEAGFFPGVIVYLSHWFLCEDRGKATGNFMSAIPLSLMLGSPLAGWILGHHWLGVQGWRWLFVLEGIPAIFLGVAAFFYLTDRPHEAAWLDADQRQWIEQKLLQERPIRAQAISGWQALKSRTVLLLAAANFLSYFVFYIFVFWFPTMFKRQSGLSYAQVGLLGALPYLAAFIAMLVNGWHSDKRCERRWHTAVPLFIAAIGSLGLMGQPRSIALSLLLFTTIYVGNAYLVTFWAMPADILGASVAPAAVGMISALASIAGFAGPYAFGYLNTRTGSFSSGLVAMVIAAALAGALILRIPEGHRGTVAETGVRAQSAL